MNSDRQMNARLARLLGWGEVAENTLTKSGLAGYGPGGYFAPVPDWCGDWADLMPLACEHQIDLTHGDQYVWARWGFARYVDQVVSENSAREVEARRVVVLALIEKLGSENA